MRCECGKSRSLHEATELDTNALGTCRGKRPWLGVNTEEDCNQPSRLLIRTASNAYFPQVFSVLSLPDTGGSAERAVRDVWDILQAVHSSEMLDAFMLIPRVAERLEGIGKQEILRAIDACRGDGIAERNVKEVELDALLHAPEGYGDDVPIDPNFHARSLPDNAWRQTELSNAVATVVQLHRLREVVALIGFTRLEAATRDIHGEYDTDVERAEIALDPQWFPAIENRGEGVFLQLASGAVNDWLILPAVQQRERDLTTGYRAWGESRKVKHPFPGAAYILLHTIAHLLIQSLAMRCGYPATSIRERIYVEGGRYALLLYTGTPDAEGTLGGLVQQARFIEGHLRDALRMAQLCSNDPICAQHTPGESLEQRWLHGAACHGCALIAETSCEMRNDYLDRALVVPVLGVDDAAFFPSQP